MSVKRKIQISVLVVELFFFPQSKCFNKLHFIGVETKKSQQSTYMMNTRNRYLDEQTRLSETHQGLATSFFLLKATSLLSDLLMIHNRSTVET